VLVGDSVQIVLDAEAGMSEQRQDSGKPDPNSKAEPEKKDSETLLTEKELRAISGGFVIKGHQPPQQPTNKNTPY